MKILYCGIFNDHELGGDIIFEKGLIQNGADVERFDYRTIVQQNGIEFMLNLLVKRAINKDLLFIGKGEVVTPNSLKMVKKLGVTIVLWYGDIRKNPEEWLLSLLPYVDFYFMSSGGEILKEYYNKGKPSVAAYYFNPSDPELEQKYSTLNKSKNNNILFTGTAYNFASIERNETIKYLINRRDAVFYGNAPDLIKDEISYIKLIFMKFNKRKYRKRVRGLNYISAIKSSKIGIGVNAIEDIPLYLSDRLTHFMTFGTFFLMREVPKIELLFERNKELVCFNNIDDLDKKINYYLKNEEERKMIEINAQKRILVDYNCKNIVGMILDIVKTCKSDRFLWVDVLK